MLRGTLFSFPVFQTERHPQQPSAGPPPPAQLGCNGSWGKHLTHLPRANYILQIFCRRQLSFLMPLMPEERFVPFAFTVHAASSIVFLRAKPVIPQDIACFCTSASPERIGMLVLLKTSENRLLKGHSWLNKLLFT